MQCQGPTCGFLAARPRSHPVPLYLAFTLRLTHVRSHAGYLMHDILLTHNNLRTLSVYHASSHSHPEPRYRALTLSHVHLARSVSLHTASLCHPTFCLAFTLAQYHAVPFSSCAALTHTTVTPPSHYLALTITLTHVLSRTVAHWLTSVINMLFTWQVERSAVHAEPHAIIGLAGAAVQCLQKRTERQLRLALRVLLSVNWIIFALVPRYMQLLVHELDY